MCSPGIRYAIVVIFAMASLMFSYFIIKWQPVTTGEFYVLDLGQTGSAKGNYSDSRFVS